MVFLMLVFEWITAGFALDYVADELQNIAGKTKERYRPGIKTIICNSVSIAWNIVLLLAILILFSRIPWNNAMLACVVTSLALIRQILHIFAIHGYMHWVLVVYLQTSLATYSLEKIVTRYFEYALTAPLLLIAVQGIVGFAPGWSFAVAYVCMVLTNILGIPIHKLAMYKLHYARDTDKPNAINITNITLAMILTASWMAFLTCWIVYIAEIVPFFGDVPDEIKVLLVILPVFFTLFGLAGSTLYLSVLARLDDIAHVIENKLDFTYDVLSLVVKILVVLIVFTSEEFKPNSCP